METFQIQVNVVIQRLLDMVNSHDFNLAPHIYAGDYSGIDLTSQTRVQGPAQAASALQEVCHAFPDLTFRANDLLFDHDRVAVYWVARGTHQAEAFNLPATGRPVTVHGVSLLRVADGKLVHGVHLWDMAALLRAVGLLPELDENLPPDPFKSLAALTME